MITGASSPLFYQSEYHITLKLSSIFVNASCGLERQHAHERTVCYSSLSHVADCREVFKCMYAIHSVSYSTEVVVNSETGQVRLTIKSRTEN